MPKYTYADVIFDPADPRVKIGAKYYFALGAQACINYANSGRREHTLDGVDKSGEYNPFITDEKDHPFTFIIRKKEPEKKYRPFDLNNEEDRARLRGAWIKYKCAPRYEYQITAVHTDRIFMYGDDKTPEDLLEDCLFLDGTPCGQEVEE